MNFDEQSERTESIDFDWEAIEATTPEELRELSQEDLERAIAGFRMLVKWVWQAGMKNPEGITIRSILVCWIFLSELRHMQLTELANGFGKHKQSMGRWVDDFKLRFPGIRLPHMK